MTVQRDDGCARYAMEVALTVTVRAASACATSSAPQPPPAVAATIRAASRVCPARSKRPPARASRLTYSASCPSARARWARASAPLPARRCRPTGRQTLGRGEVGPRPVEVADVGAGDRGRHVEHDVAEHAAVCLRDDGLGLLDDPAGGDRVRCGSDHRAVDPLHQVHAHHRPAGQRQRRSQELPSTFAVAAREAHLGQPLQAQAPHRRGRPRRGAARPPRPARARRGRGHP